MTPKVRRTLIRIAAGIGFLLVLIWLMSALESVTTMVMAAFILAYILDPLAKQLERIGLSRAISVGVIILSGLSLVVALFLVLIPAIVGEIASFAVKAPKYAEILKDMGLQALERLNVEAPKDWDSITPMLVERARQIIPKLADPVARIVASVFRSTLHVLAAVLQIALVPILTYYLMVSFDSIKQGIVDLIPPYTREPVLERLGEMDRVLSSFIRGQLTVATILAVLYSAGFLVIGLDLALVLGIISGLLWIIPYLGTMVALVAGTSVALAKFGDVTHVAYVLGWIGVVQLMEGYILTPRIVGQAIGLHPVVYILALIVGANLFGFVGLLVAIPVTAVCNVLLRTGLEAYRTSYLYTDGPEERAQSKIE